MTFDIVIYATLVFIVIVGFTIAAWKLFNMYAKLSKHDDSDKYKIEELDIDIKSLLMMVIGYAFILLFVIICEYIKSGV